ncbi:MAG: T9SS type A sorting domain-containing protein, partial [Saprospiraceae bacterium]
MIDLSGLNNIHTIERECYIDNNNSLTTLNGLASLTNIGGNLRLSENASLTDLSLINDSLVINEELIIKENPQLSHCAIKAFCEHLTLGGAAQISQNGTDCGSVEEVIAACTGDLISGFVYYDFNQNQSKDEFEPGIPMQAILVDPQGVFLFTSQNGLFYLIGEEEQAYTFTLQEDANWELISDSVSYTKTFIPYSEGNRNNNFGLYPTFVNHNFEIITTAGQTRCNSEAEFLVDACNTGTFLETNGEVVLVFDDLVQYVSANPEPTMVDMSGQRIIWTFDTLYPWQCLHFEITFEMPSEVFIGDTIFCRTEVYRDSIGGAILTAENLYASEVVCAYDPNDKLVIPAGEQPENYTLKETLLDYTIRFQNTGNIEAIDVLLRDTLDVDLDWESFRVVQASHPVQTSLSLDGVLEFFFKDIYLPDSMSNPLESQGFVRYSIKPKEGLPDLTLIENTAYIYFDQNPPIVTNTTINTLMDMIPVGTENIREDLAFQIFPNPTTGRSLFLTNNSSTVDDYKCKVMDLSGKVVRQFIITSEGEID